ncbi:PAAR domain-containing protein [Buttiauxella sp. A2-C1_F]|uniref:PAAR domain-containing protein n=1 Tax=unclassified Buttiauxella TaxID=2634062 RepID=UPI001E3C1650|nr:MULTISPECIES: PAAR domain-containing protein [unclassified Buttiauxella]MCE0811565.1 PAAR domain-containing protein [Buttiauxella sp. S04-F03]MCE0844172.1 PAAR domain-containing protein [Buttiauxella sp. A2-C1_F]
MKQPAARVNDMHVCPMVIPGTVPVPHVGGPIQGPGIAKVKIGGMTAATEGDVAVCNGPPDSIKKGSSKVKIGGKPAARVGDLCAHGGKIVAGFPKVLIG